LNEIFRQTLIGSYTHPFHVRNEIAIGKEQLGRKNLSANLNALIQIRLITIRNPKVSIAKEVFQLVGHGESHRVLWQALGYHHRGAEMIVDKRAAQVSETVGPFINGYFVLGVNPHQVVGENAW
jgi:hypothetical protein